MMPTPASFAAGSTSSSGLSLNALKMIWTLATLGRAIAVSASSTVSTLTPYARHDALLHQQVEGVEHLVAREHRRRRAVQLDQVERVDAEVGAGAIGPGPEVVEREVRRVLLGAAAHLGGDQDVEVGPCTQVFADQLLASAVAVDVRGVEERHAGIGRTVEHGDRLVMGHIAPVGTELPRAEAHDRHLASRATQRAYVHRLLLVRGEVQPTGAWRVGPGPPPRGRLGPSSRPSHAHSVVGINLDQGAAMNDINPLNKALGHLFWPNQVQNASGTVGPQPDQPTDWLRIGPVGRRGVHGVLDRDPGHRVGDDRHHLAVLRLALVALVDHPRRHRHGVPVVDDRDSRPDRDPVPQASPKAALV